MNKSAFSLLCAAALSGFATLASASDVSVAALRRPFHGVAYYPELWPNGDLDRDVAEMKKLGLDVVRIGEFAWAKMEPDEGKIDLSYFRSVLDRMQAEGIRVILCTPTATPPVWLVSGHPERCFVTSAGEVMSHGSRQHASYDNPDVRAACARIVEAMARELGSHPAVIGWQIDNELKCHVAEDFNPSSVANWHRWLARRYGNIETLNTAWGTEIWSERYQNFDQVPAPVKVPFIHNASLSSAWLQYSREAIAEFLGMQCEIIRRYSKAPITHNLNLGFKVNFELMARQLDFVSFDDYPPASSAFAMVLDCDFFRSAKVGKPFWVMETSSSFNGWLGNHETAHPAGFLTAEAVACWSLGAESFNYWLWRQQRTGCELPHSAIMSAWFAPELGYGEVQQVEQARRALMPLLQNSRVVAPEIALTWSDRARAMMQVEPLGANRSQPLDYTSQLRRYHSLLTEAGYPRDFRFEDASLDGLKILITPYMPYVSPAFRDRVKAFVEAGGVWICGPVTGTRTAEHTVPTDAGLGLVDQLAGVKTQLSFPTGGSGSSLDLFGVQAPVGGWCSTFAPATPETKVLGTLSTPLPAQGQAVVTERALGKGYVVVLGVEPEGESGGKLLRSLIDTYANRTGVTPRYSARPGTLVSPRIDKDGTPLWIVVNLDGTAGGATLPWPAVDGIDGTRVDPGAVSIPAYGWRVFRARKG